jgi:hypothetical protein
VTSKGQFQLEVQIAANYSSGLFLQSIDFQLFAINHEEAGNEKFAAIRAASSIQVPQKVR